MKRTSVLDLAFCLAVIAVAGVVLLPLSAKVKPPSPGDTTATIFVCANQQMELCAQNAIPSQVVAGSTAALGQSYAVGHIYPTSGPGTAAALAHDTWSSFPAPPVGLSGHIAVWTGKALLVVSDSGTTGAYDPGTRHWTLLATSPLEWADDAAFVWTGSELFVLGGVPPASDGSIASAGAMFDPASNRWTVIRDSPLLPPRPWQAVWDGGVIIVVTGPSLLSSSGTGPFPVVFYDPIGQSWGRILDVPIDPNQTIDWLTAGAANRQLHVFETWSHYVSTNNADGTTTGTGTSGAKQLTFNNVGAIDAWDVQTSSPLEDAPLVARSVIWTGSIFLTPASNQCPPGALCGVPSGFGSHGWVWNPVSRQWSSIAPGPVDALNPTLTVWTGSALVRAGTTTSIGNVSGALSDHPGEAAVWDANVNQWSRLPDSGSLTSWSGNPTVAVWAGDRILIPYSWEQFAP